MLAKRRSALPRIWTKVETQTIAMRAQRAQRNLHRQHATLRARDAGLL